MSELNDNHYSLCIDRNTSEGNDKLYSLVSGKVSNVLIDGEKWGTLSSNNSYLFYGNLYDGIVSDVLQNSCAAPISCLCMSYSGSSDSSYPACFTIPLQYGGAKEPRDLTFVLKSTICDTTICIPVSSFSGSKANKVCNAYISYYCMGDGNNHFSTTTAPRDYRVSEFCYCCNNYYCNGLYYDIDLKFVTERMYNLYYYSCCGDYCQDTIVGCGSATDKKHYYCYKFENGIFHCENDDSNCIRNKIVPKLDAKSAAIASCDVIVWGNFCCESCSCTENTIWGPLYHWSCWFIGCSVNNTSYSVGWKDVIQQMPAYAVKSEMYGTSYVCRRFGIQYIGIDCVYEYKNGIVTPVGPGDPIWE